jgi:hypothetical protein
MAVPAFGAKDRIGFVAGLIDWSGDRPPNEDDLAGKPVLEQAKTRFEAIGRTGGEVLGERPLEMDGLVPLDPSDLSVGSQQKLWGWATITRYANDYFAKPS